MRRRPAPVWFALLVALLVAWLARAWTPAPAAAPDVQLAFWGWLVFIVELIWTGVQAVGDVSLYILTLFVNSLSVIVQGIAKGLKTFGVLLQKGGLELWKFFRTTYDHILKPAWQKFFRFVDWAKRTLDDFFQPIFRFLRHLRDELLGFYTKWVRPILDSIGVARKVLSVFRALGLEWAKKLDAKLADLEAAIDRPFRLLLAKINEVLNLLNRIVTADGLFQRLALVRSVERDVRFIVNAWHNSQSKPLTDDERRAALARDNYKSADQINAEFLEYLDTGQGPDAAIVDEWSADLKLLLGRP